MIHNRLFKLNLICFFYIKLQVNQMETHSQLSLYFDMNHASDNELKEIAQLSFSGPSVCYSDIDLVGDEIIFRLDMISYDLSNKEHKPFVNTVRYIYKILQKIKSDRILTIHNKFNDYLQNSSPSPGVSPVYSPHPIRNP